jgi:Ca2+-binding RTX toxin-like protein
MAVIQGTSASEVLEGTSSSDSIFGAGGNDDLYGRGGDDLLDGGTGNDFLDGGSGDDDLIGGLGFNDLRGGSGLDLFVMSQRTTAGFSDDLIYDFTFDEDQVDLTAWGVSDFAQVTALLAIDSTGSATLNAFYGGFDHVLTLDDIWPDDLIESDFVYANPGALNATGTADDDVMFGSRNGDVLRGLAGSDILLGGLGNDLLYGGTGLNDLIGGTGSDSYFVGDQRDFIEERAGEGSLDRVFASVSYALTHGAEIEIMSTDNHAGTAAINLTGNELANTIYGNDGANRLDGGGGADLLVGRLGDDFYYLDSAADRITENAGQGNDRLFASTNYVLAAGVSVEVLATVNDASTAAIKLTGNELASTIYGNAGANVLDGKGGNDVMVGQGGADTFAFTSALGATNVDSIIDFAPGSDRIALDDAVFAGIGGPGALNPNAFFAGAAAHDADDRIIYDQATGNLFFDADGNGAGAAILFANLTTHPVVTAGDFTVI